MCELVLQRHLTLLKGNNKACWSGPWELQQHARLAKLQTSHLEVPKRVVSMLRLVPLGLCRRQHFLLQPELVAMTVLCSIVRGNSVRVRLASASNWWIIAVKHSKVGRT